MRLQSGRSGRLTILKKKKKQEALLEKIQLRVQLCGTDAECSKNLVPSNSGGWRDESGLRGEDMTCLRCNSKVHWGSG